MAGAALCEPPRAEFVAGTALCDLHAQSSWQAQHLWMGAENWRLCSTTLVRGVSAELEAENWRLCSTTLVSGVSGELEDESDFLVQL